MKKNTHGGKRIGSGRVSNNPSIAVEKRRMEYMKNYPSLSEEEIKKKIKVDAVKLKYPEWFEYVDSDEYGKGYVDNKKETIEKYILEGMTYEQIVDKMNV